jgi:hypothetical protein
MNKPTFYEQVGIIIPGSILVFGLVLYYPELKLLTTKDSMSVGDLGLFVLIAYAAGHLIAAVANPLESMFWGLLGGMVAFLATASRGAVAITVVYRLYGER